VGFVKGPGFVSLTSRNELLSLWAALLIVIAIGIGVYQDWKDFQKTTLQVQHARQVMEKTEALLSHMMDAETGQRGYLLTGKAEYLAPYERALQLVPNALEDLNELNREDELGQREMARLRPLVSQKLNELRETIELRQTQGLTAALEVVLSNRGKITMDQIRALSAQITDEAYSRVTRQNEAAQLHAERAPYRHYCRELVAVCPGGIRNSNDLARDIPPGAVDRRTAPSKERDRADSRLIASYSGKHWRRRNFNRSRRKNFVPEPCSGNGHRVEPRGCRG